MNFPTAHELYENWGYNANQVYHPPLNYPGFSEWKEKVDRMCELVPEVSDEPGNLEFFNSIEKLDIPTIMKDYLMGDGWGMYDWLVHHQQKAEEVVDLLIKHIETYNEPYSNEKLKAKEMNKLNISFGSLQKLSPFVYALQAVTTDNFNAVVDIIAVTSSTEPASLTIRKSMGDDNWTSSESEFMSVQHSRNNDPYREAGVIAQHEFESELIGKAIEQINYDLSQIAEEEKFCSLWFQSDIEFNHRIVK